MSQLTDVFVRYVRQDEFSKSSTIDEIPDLLGNKNINKLEYVKSPLPSTLVNIPGKIVSNDIILTLAEYKSILKNYQGYNGFYIPDNTTVIDTVKKMYRAPRSKIGHTFEEVKSILDLEYDIIHGNLDHYDILDRSELKRQNAEDMEDLHLDFGAYDQNHELRCNRIECSSQCQCYICDSCCGCSGCRYSDTYNESEFVEYDKYDVHIPNKKKTIKPFRQQHRLLQSLPSDIFNKDGMLMIIRPNKGPFVKLKQGVIVEYNSKEYCVIDNQIYSDQTAHITLLRNIKTPFKRKTFKRNVFAGRKTFY